MTAARNILIIAVVAGAIVALPGGGTAADVIYSLLSVVFALALGLALVRLYMERRVDIYGLSDRDRSLLYVAIVVLALTLAAFSRLDGTISGDVVLAALIGFSVWAMAFVYNAWRAY